MVPVEELPKECEPQPHGVLLAFDAEFPDRDQEGDDEPGQEDVEDSEDAMERRV